MACGVDSPVHGDLYGMSFYIFSMERGELCHDRCMGLLLAEYMQDIDAVRSDAKTRVYKPCT